MADLLVKHGSANDDIVADGSASHPYRSIQKAIDNAAAGDNIILAAGETFQLGGYKATGTGTSYDIYLEDTGATFVTDGVTTGDAVYFDGGSDAYVITAVTETRIDWTESNGIYGVSATYIIGDQLDAAIDMDNTNASLANNTPITLTSEDADDPATIEVDSIAALTEIISISENAQHVKDLTLTGASSSWTGYGVYSAGSLGGLLVDNCTITNCKYSVYFDTGLVSGVVKDCEISINTATAGYGVYTNGSGTIVLNNKITGSSAAGLYGVLANTSAYGTVILGNAISGFTGVFSRGIAANGSGSCVVNNVVYDIEAAATCYGIYIGTTTSAASIMNNIVHTCYYGIGRNGSGTGSASVLDYNCVYNCTSAYNNLTAGDNSITTDPLFVDAANGDFRLLPGSPCLNTGYQDNQGGYSSIGVWQRKAEVVSKARTANFGRLAIIR